VTGYAFVSKVVAQLRISAYETSSLLYNTISLLIGGHCYTLTESRINKTSLGYILKNSSSDLK